MLAAEVYRRCAMSKFNDKLPYQCGDLIGLGPRTRADSTRTLESWCYGEWKAYIEFA